MRRPGREGRRSAPKTALLAAGAAIGFAAGWWLPGRVSPPQGAPRLLVQRVAIAGADRVAPAALARRAGVAAGTPIAQVDRDRVAAQLSEDPWVLEARATTLPPDRLLVSVEERVPVLVAWLGRPAEPWHVDATGTPFARLDWAEPGTPEVFGLGAFEPGEPHPDLVRAVAVAERVGARGVPVKAIELEAPEPGVVPVVTAELLGAERRLWIGPAELAGALDRLALLLAAPPPAARDASIWDLRFGEQVVLRSDALASLSPGGPRERGRPLGSDWSE